MKITRTGTPFDLDAFLQQPLMAHLATACAEGPRESPVWFAWEGGALWFIGSSHDSWPRRVRDDSRCAVGIVEFDLSRGVLRHVGMRGRGEAVAVDRARLVRFLRRYLGEEATWDPWFRENVIDTIDLMVRFTPQTVVMHDQSYFASRS